MIFDHVVGVYRKGNQKGTVQRNWQHRIHKTKTDTNENHNTIFGYHYMQANANNVNGPSYQQLEVKMNRTSLFMHTS